MPDVWRIMNAIFSGVQSEPATKRSPSFSRSSSSVTTTTSPRAKAAIACSIWVCVRSSMAAILRLRERPIDRLADLAAMAQILVGDDAGDHRLADRHRADADAGVVAALGRDFGLAAVTVDCLAGGMNGRSGLHREARDEWRAGRNAAENPAGVIGKEFRL